ncbi:MAG: hypothetical protein ABII64_06700 [Elusimicrobiota bacterium]
MKTIVRCLAVLFIAVFIVAGSEAEEKYKRTGIGIVLGAPSGLDAKIWFARDKAIDIAFGWGYWNVWAQATYQWHYWLSDENADNKDFSAPLYVGVGGFAGGGRKEVGLGPIGVVGVDILFKKAPFDIFIEIGPAIQIAPESAMFFHGGIGVRYYLP